PAAAVALGALLDLAALRRGQLFTRADQPFQGLRKAQIEHKPHQRHLVPAAVRPAVLAALEHTRGQVEPEAILAAAAGTWADQLAARALQPGDAQPVGDLGNRDRMGLLQADVVGAGHDQPSAEASAARRATAERSS